MSDVRDFLSKMEDFVKEAKNTKTPDSGWKSRKLWITVGSVIAFVFLFKASLPLIIWPLSLIISVYLAGQALVDYKKKETDADIKKQLLLKLSSGGLTKDEVEIVKQVTE